MKITFFVYSICGMGGTVRATVNTANYLVTHGYTVEIISAKRTQHEPLFKIDQRVKLTWLLDARQDGSFLKKCFRKVVSYFPSRLIDNTEDLYRHFNLFIDARLIYKLKRISEGIVITTIPSFNMAQVKYANKNVIKIGQEHKDFVVHHPSLQEKIKSAYGDLDIVMCLTEKEASRYRDFLSGEARVVSIENTTQIPNIQTELKSKMIISAGRFEYEKGYDLLIKAFEKIAYDFPDWTLKIFGRGSEEMKLKEMVKERNLDRQIFICSIEQNIQKEMKRASLYVLSSRNESFGLTIIEAMAVGLPVVSFACIGPSEIIDHQKDGLLVEERNIDKLAAAITYMISSPARLAEYSQHALAKVNQYSNDVVGTKWKMLLTELVENSALSQETVGLEKSQN